MKKGNSASISTQKISTTVAAQDNLEFTQAEQTAIARQLDEAQKRFEVGLIAVTDVKEAQAQFDRATAELLLA